MGAFINEAASVSNALSSAEVFRRMTVPRSSLESIIFATSSNCKLLKGYELKQRLSSIFEMSGSTTFCESLFLLIADFFVLRHCKKRISLTPRKSNLIEITISSHSLS